MPDKVLNSVEFLRLLNQPGIVVEISECKIYDEITVSQDDFKCDGVRLNNCNFFNSLIFKEINLKHGISIISCELFENLTFVQCEQTQVPTPIYETAGICIHWSKIKGIFSFQGINKIKYGILLNEDQIFMLDFKKIKVDEGSIKVVKTTLDDLCIFENNQVSSDIIFYHSIIKTFARIENNKVGELKFESYSVFEKGVRISGGVVQNGVSIISCRFCEQLKITAIVSDGALIVANSEFEWEIIITYFNDSIKDVKGFNEVQLLTSKFKGGIYFHGTPEIPYYSPVLKSVNILCSAQLSGLILFRGFKIEKLHIGGENTGANIIFEWIEAGNLEFGIINNSNIKFYQLSAIPEKSSNLKIINSNMGRTEFYNVDFSSFKIVTIKDSIISSIITSNVIWFTKTQLRPLRNDSVDWAVRREMYRQLKSIMEKQGNRIQALVFKKYEMEAYNEEVKFENRWNWDRIIMFLNKSNDYGLNWVKPALFALGFAIAFYCLLIVSHSDKLGWHMTFSKAAFHNTINVWWQNKKMIPQMLNPAHSMDDLLGKGVYISGFTYTIDYCYRLILAYFIYQTIVAFRKYSK